MNVAKRDAYWLLNEKYGGEETPEYYNDLKRLEDGEPIAYVIGWIPFLNARIKLGMRPLIPRPETEYWANEAFKIVEKKYGHVYRYSLADCYSGSGCIGVGALMFFPKAQCTFIDIGKEECTQIEENIRSNVLHKERASIIQGDAMEMMAGPYDAIFANPPYIDIKENNVDDSVMKWEPHRALYAEDDGLREIRKILLKSKYYLKKDGILFCEFGKDQEKKIKSLEEAKNWNIIFHNDQYGVIRWFEANIKNES